MNSRSILLAVSALPFVVAGCIRDSDGLTVPETPKTEISSEAPLLGVAVPNGRSALVRDLEVETGATFTVIRSFARWDSTMPDSDQQALLDAGRRLHLSIRPVMTTGEVISWRMLAEAKAGEPLFSELTDWVDRVVALGPGTYVTINHEPETRESRANGTSEDYVAMWRRFVELVRQRGGVDTVMVWTMTGGSFSDGRAEAWYPGDDVVDVVGADVYNWHTCQGTERPWRQLETLLQAPLEFARSHEKPLALPEFASVEDDAVDGRKGQWIEEAALTLGQSDIAGDIEFVAWFNVTAPGGTWPNCVWDHDTSQSSSQAFTALALSLQD